MLAVRLLLLAVAGCGARTSLESPFSETGGESEVEACAGWTIDGPASLIPNPSPIDTSDIGPSLVRFQDGSLSLLFFRAQPPDAPRGIVRSRIEGGGAWPPQRSADEILANGFCDARVSDEVDGAFGALVKDHGDEGCEAMSRIRWFAPIEASASPPFPAYEELSVTGIIAAAQGSDHALLAIRVYKNKELVRIVDSHGTVLFTHDVSCAFMTESALWFEGHFYVMARHDTCSGTGEEGLSVFRVNPSTGTMEWVAQWPTSGAVDRTAIVASSDALWYAWSTYGQEALQLIRADTGGAPLTAPMDLPWTRDAGAFALAALRDRLALARYEYRDNETASVALDWIDRDGALLEQVTFPVEPGGAWLDVAVDDHTAIVAWDSYATELTTFRVWLGRASCR